ncbi:type II toxin-antitoxin system Phd/YefM family antitoxin [Nitrincola sp. MINF-07-Sa-05]|uniref:type II toxin-antitoxin system Phd/YefM family antitoxin n=1 Tax=Nitrincola salilacus TaxID=3400273 RepID=UPI00391801BB
MDNLSANEAKTHFGSMLMRAQKAPVQINKNGKPVAVVMSAEDYQSIESMKLELLKIRSDRARLDVAAARLIDGEAFFDELDAGDHD